MSIIGVICPYKKKNVSFIECTTCKGCKEHGSKNEDFPLMLRKKYLFPQFKNGNGIILSVTRILGCLKKQYFNLTEDYYMDINGFKALSFGTAIHNHLENIWDLKEKRLEWITPKGNKLIGYFDVICISNRILYDIKTTAYGKYRVSDGEPDIKDKTQILIYATMLKRFMDLEGIKLTYIGLGDKVCDEFDIDFEDMSEYMNTNTDYLYDCLDKKQIPKGKPLSKWECDYCPFSNDCEDKIQ